MRMMLAARKGRPQAPPDASVTTRGNPALYGARPPTTQWTTISSPKGLKGYGRVAPDGYGLTVLCETISADDA